MGFSGPQRGGRRRIQDGNERRLAFNTSAGAARARRLSGGRHGFVPVVLACLECTTPAGCRAQLFFLAERSCSTPKKSVMELFSPWSAKSIPSVKVPLAPWMGPASPVPSLRPLMLK